MIDRADVADGLDILDLVNSQGREFVPAPRPKGFRKMADGACFYNAMHTVLDHPEVSYAEGLAMTDVSGLYVHHAWNVDRDGRAIDRTWPTPGKRYVGIVIDRKTVAKRVVATGFVGGSILAESE
jgi:hypothetical protein